MQCTHTYTHIQTLAMVLYRISSGSSEPPVSTEDIASQTADCCLGNKHNCIYRGVMCRWDYCSEISLAALVNMLWGPTRCKISWNILKNKCPAYFYYLRKYFLQPSNETKPKFDTKQTKSTSVKEHLAWSFSMYSLWALCWVCQGWNTGKESKYSH